MSETKPTLDLTTIGPVKGRIKIASIKLPDKPEHAIEVKIEGHAIPLKAFANKAELFGTKLEVGAEDEAEIEVKPPKSGYPQVWLKSFGAKHAAQKGRTFTPTSDAEIHGEPVAKIVVACLQRSMPDMSDFDSKVDQATAAYFRSLGLSPLGKGSAAMATPLQAPITPAAVTRTEPQETEEVQLEVQTGGAPEDPDREAKEAAVKYWHSKIDGSRELLTKLKATVKGGDRKWFEVILEGRDAGKMPEAILLEAEGQAKQRIFDQQQPLEPSEKVHTEIADRDWYKAFSDLATELGWPEGWVSHPTGYQKIYSRVLKRNVRYQQQVIALTQTDYWKLYCFAKACQDGTDWEGGPVENPFPFNTHAKSKQRGAKGA